MLDLVYMATQRIYAHIVSMCEYNTKHMHTYNNITCAYISSSGINIMHFTSCMYKILCVLYLFFYSISVIVELVHIFPCILWLISYFLPPFCLCLFFVMLYGRILQFGLTVISILLFFLFVEFLNMILFLIFRISICYIFIEAFSYFSEDINCPFLKTFFSFVFQAIC